MIPNQPSWSCLKVSDVWNAMIRRNIPSTQEAQEKPDMSFMLFLASWWPGSEMAGSGWLVHTKGSFSVARVSFSATFGLFLFLFSTGFTLAPTLLHITSPFVMSDFSVGEHLGACLSPLQALETELN